MLIMIIIKIIILYFIQITHTGDFPSMGTRLVVHNNRRQTSRQKMARMTQTNMGGLHERMDSTGGWGGLCRNQKNSQKRRDIHVETYPFTIFITKMQQEDERIL